MKINTPKQIEKELQTIENGESRNWGEISILIDAVESTGYWHRDSDSFTEWLEKNAFRFGVKPPMLWRILTAGRFVRQAKEHFREIGIAIPDIEKIPDNVGAESIELMAKIQRAIPEEIFTDLAQKVFAGQIKRSELKSMWESYRPVLAGQTARGRGVPPPCLNTKDPKQSEYLLEAMSIEALKASSPSWSGYIKPKAYQIFLHVNPDGYQLPPGFYLFSAVVVIKPQNTNIEFHGFCYGAAPVGRNITKDCDDELAYCDFVWYMIPPKFFKEDRISKLLDRYPACGGVVSLSDRRFNVLRRAERVPGTGKLRDRLILELFTRCLERG